MVISNKQGMLAKWGSRIIISSAFLIFVVWVSLFYAQDSSMKLIDGLRSGLVSSAEEGDETMKFRLKTLISGKNMATFQTVGFTCETEEHRCITSNQVRVENSINQVTIYIPSTSGSKNANKTTQMMQPYVQRGDPNMRLISLVRILQGNLSDTALPTCQYNHTVPAVVFSSGGFMVNMYHALDEFLIPLFLTTRHFKSNVQFYIIDFNPKVVYKYRQFLRRLSNFKPIDSSTNGTLTHCFPGAIIGLNYHGNVAVNYSDIPYGYTLTDFRRFMYESYNLKASDMETRQIKDKPVLILISRSRSRVLLNENDMVRLLQDVGFQVHVALEKETSNFEQFARVLSTCDVLLGVHGAGLSNSVFLPQGAVLLQVVPLGLIWPGRYTYGEPATRMGLRHVEYMIEPNESSLVEVYSPDDPVINDPQSVFAKGYMVGRAIYIEGQNVTVNLTRFKETIQEVFHLVQLTVHNTTKVLE